MNQLWETVIVGGGASGLAAAVFYARAVGGDKVLVLEKNARVGKKLLATGNGTCNITNTHVDPSHYHGVHAASFVRSALSHFDTDAATDFFHSIGIPCKTTDTGRVYPLCEQAAAVLDSLRLTLDTLGVTVRCDCAVTDVCPQKNGFRIVTDNETFAARRVFLATGGAAAPSLGGSAQSYALPVSLGHRKTPLFPSIVQVRTDTAYIRAMKGLRTDATVTFLLNGQPLASQFGEVLFTEYGVSGPAVMQISRVVGDWERQKRGVLTVSLDLLPDYTDDDLLKELQSRRALCRLGEDFLTGLLHKRIGQTVCRAAGVSLSETTASLPDTVLRRLCDTAKRFTVSVIGTQGFGGAQVTAGGIDTETVCPDTMESRLVPGLYLLGELLDVDGDCGGYNLHWAWASAYAAVQAATEGLR